MKIKPGEKIVLAWSQKYNAFTLLPLQRWLEALQDAFVQGARSGPDVMVLAVVKSRREAQDLAQKLRRGSEYYASTREEIITEIA